MKQTPTKGKQIQKRLRLWLLSGKSITHNEAQKMYGTNRLAEYIRRIRVDDRLPIKMEMIYEGNGDCYGKYSLVKEKKVNRIESGQYQRV